MTRTLLAEWLFCFFAIQFPFFPFSCSIYMYKRYSESMRSLCGSISPAVLQTAIFGQKYGRAWRKKPFAGKRLPEGGGHAVPGEGRYRVNIDKTDRMYEVNADKTENSVYFRRSILAARQRNTENWLCPAQLNLYYYTSSVRRNQGENVNIPHPGEIFSDVVPEREWQVHAKARSRAMPPMTAEEEAAPTTKAPSFWPMGFS